MALDLHPLYHTETMVRILREQGSSLHAMELAEIILEKQPEHQAVAQLLGEMKDEARASFERFRQAGRVEDRAEASDVEAAAGEGPPQIEASLVSDDSHQDEPTKNEPSQAVETLGEKSSSIQASQETVTGEEMENSPEGVRSSEDLPDNVVALPNASPPPPPPQVRVLENLLNRVQAYRKSHGH